MVIFDGFCGLCARVVQFTLRHDRKGHIRFLAAQTELGTGIYRHYGLDAEDYDTFILLDDGKAQFASDAAIALLQHLGGAWRLTAALRLVPRALRDWSYALVARNRMRFFGRTEACYLPTPDTRDRFLVG